MSASKSINKIKENYFDNTTSNQRLKILNWLKQNKSLSTFEGRTKLGISHPAGRICELRKEGYNIITHRIIEHDLLNKPHKIARYVLLSKRRRNGYAN